MPITVISDNTCVASISTANGAITTGFGSSQANDVVYLFGGHGNTNPARLGPDPATETGWVTIYTDQTDGTAITVGLYRKVLTGPITNINIQSSNSSFLKTGFCAVVLRGVDLTTPEDGVTVTQAGSGAGVGAPDAPSITPAMNNGIILIGGISANNDTAVTAPTNYTVASFVAPAGTGPVTVELAYRTGVTAGTPEDPAVWTNWNTANAWKAFSASIRAAGGPYVLSADPSLYRLCGGSRINDYGDGIHFDGQTGSTIAFSYTTHNSVPPNYLPRRWILNNGAIISDTDSKFGGTSLYLNGSSWVDIFANSGFGGANNNSFTYGFHFKPTAGDGTLRYLMGSASPTGANNILSVYLDANNKLNFKVTTGIGTTQTLTSTSTFPVSGNFYYVSFGQSRSLGSEPISYLNSLWVNGVREGQSSIDSRADVQLNSYKFSIGRMGEYPSNYFTGYIDEWFGIGPQNADYSGNGIGRLVPLGDIPQVKFSKGKVLAANMGYYAITNKVIVSPSNMISDNSPPPYQVSASTILGAGYESYLAFDGTASFAHSGTPLPWWIKIDLGSSQLVGYYKLTSRFDGIFHEWIDWVLEGSNDNVNWFLCHTVVGEAGWVAGQTRSYQCDFWGTYRFWRWTVSKSTSGSAAAGTGYAEAAALELDGVVPSQATLRTTHNLFAASGAYTVTGNMINQRLLHGYRVIATNGSYVSYSFTGHDQYVKTLLHMDGANNGTSFIDSTTPTRSWTNNLATTSTVQSKFGTASGLFNGSQSFLQTPIHTSLDPGAGDWTVDCWVYPTISGVDFKAIFNGGYDGVSSATRTIELNISSSVNNQVYVNVFVGINITQVFGSNVGINAWHHIEANRSGGLIRIFVDGVLIATNTISGAVNAGSNIGWTIGRLPSVGYYYGGYIDELRYSVGIARHTANFTLPTLPYGKEVTFLLGKSLLAGQGSYALAGKDVTSKRLVYSLSASKGNYGITGNAQTLAYGYRVRAANGIYNTASFVTFGLGKAVIANRGIYSTIGQTALLKAIRVSLMSNENYTITGRDAALRSIRKFYTANGIYSTAGKTVTFYRNYVVTVPTGIYTMAGKSGTNVLPAVRTNYVLSGKNVNAGIGYRILSDKGTYGLSGKNVTSRQTYALASAKGNYLLTGTVTLRASHKLYALYSSYGLTGNTVVLRSQHKSYPAQASYQINGGFVRLRTAHKLYPTVRSFTLVPNPAILLLNHKLYPVKGDYGVIGKAVILRFNHQINSVTGIYAVNGKSLVYQAKRTIYSNKGNYTQTGKIAITLHKCALLAVSGTYTVKGRVIYLVNVASKSYSISGKNNILQARRIIYLVKGTYSQTGYAANLKTVRRIIANKGNYTLISTITLRTAHKLYANNGNYIFSGKVASLVVPFRLYADRGNFTLTGKAGGLTKRSRVLAFYRTFSIKGNSASYWHIIGKGTFSLIGKVATLKRGYHTVVDYGILRLIGKPVTFIRKYALKVSQGTYGINKPNTLLTKGSAFSGDYGVVGTPVTFIRSHKRIKTGSKLEDGTPVAAVKQTIPLKRYAKLIDY
jgi:hypothetical protein